MKPASKFNFDKKTYIMGIINVTPDSFSQDGILSIKDVVKKAKQFEKDGADIIDIGGESTRPGSLPISIQEEIKRVIPAIKAIKKEVSLPISLDSYKPEVIENAISEGIDIINDITGLEKEQTISLAAKHNLFVVIMHIKGTPKDMQINPQYDNVVQEIIKYFRERIKKAKRGGITKDRIILDPGIGFGKTLEHNLEILRNIKKFKKLGFPILIGASRKSLIGQMLNLPVGERLEGGLAIAAYSILQGANILRVHDVKETKRVAVIIDRITEKQNA